MKNDRGWLPGRARASTGSSRWRAPLVRRARGDRGRGRASPERIPIVDRDSGRVLAALAGGPAADRRGRDGVSATRRCGWRSASRPTARS